MLPGLRFLFASIVLSISLLIFGLGAAALLRAAHQEFASVPSRPAPPEPVFASQGNADVPTLAMMRVDDKTADEETTTPATTDNVALESPPILATAQPPAAEPDNVAPTIPPEVPKLPETSTSETSARKEPTSIAQAPPEAEATPAPEAQRISEVPSSVETMRATSETGVPPSASQPAPADPAQTSAVTSPNDAVETKIATLAAPTVEIGTQASPIKARQRSARRAEKKRQRAERAAQRRKTAMRTRASRRASQSADPFGAQPFSGFPGASRTQ